MRRGNLDKINRCTRGKSMAESSKPRNTKEDDHHQNVWRNKEEPWFQPWEGAPLPWWPLTSAFGPSEPREKLYSWCEPYGLLFFCYGNPRDLCWWRAFSSGHTDTGVIGLFSMLAEDSFLVGPGPGPLEPQGHPSAVGDLLMAWPHTLTFGWACSRGLPDCASVAF